MEVSSLHALGGSHGGDLAPESMGGLALQGGVGVGLLVDGVEAGVGGAGAGEVDGFFARVG